MHIRIALAPILIALPLAAQQQAPDTARVEPVVVSATRVPLSRGAVPVAVTVITADDLRLKGITTVSDALRDVSSAYVAQAGSQGATTSLFLRGGESKYVKVLVDGVPANEAGGFYDFGSLTTDNIERIEIVRGPASVIHGADAVSGVVQIFTKNGRGPATAELEVRTGTAPRARSGGADAGSTTVMNAVGSMHGELPAGSYSLALARHQSSGLYEINNQYQNNVMSGRFQFAPDENTGLRLSLRYTDYRFHYPTNGGGAVVDENARRTEDRTILGGEVERRVSPKARAVLGLHASINDGGTNDAADAPPDALAVFVSQDKTRRRGGELRVHLLPATSTTVTVGVSMEQQDQQSQAQSESQFGPFNSRFSAARRNLGAYTEVVLTPAQSITATIGGRVDDNQQFGTFGTGRGGVSWWPSGSTRLRASVGTAFREPTFFENYSTGFVTGNPDLQPERAFTWDAGVEQTLFAGRASLALTGFAQRFRNMIDYESTSSSCGYSYCNVAEATSHGIEAEARGRMYGPIWGAAGATFLKTKVIDPGYDSTSGGLYRRGESLIRRPERNVSAELAYRGASPATASVRVLAVGVRHDRDFRTFPATPVTLPAYERVDLAGQYALPGGRTSLSLRVENVANAHYESVFNFLTPRRTITLGVRSAF